MVSCAARDRTATAGGSFRGRAHRHNALELPRKSTGDKRHRPRLNPQHIDVGRETNKLACSSEAKENVEERSCEHMGDGRHLGNASTSQELTPLVRRVRAMSAPPVRARHSAASARVLESLPVRGREPLVPPVRLTPLDAGASLEGIRRISAK